MKFKLIALSVLLFNIALTSCNNTQTQNNSNTTQTNTEHTAVEQTKNTLEFEEIKSKPLSLKKSDSIFNFNSNDPQSLTLYSNEYLYLSKFDDDGTQFGRQILYQLSLKDKTKKELKNIVMPSFSNGLLIPAGNEIYYASGFYRDSNSSDVVKYDFNNNKQEVIYKLNEKKSSSGVLYASSQKNNDIPEFLIIESLDVTETETTYTYDKIIPNTNESTTLFTKKYNPTDSSTHFVAFEKNNLIILDSTTKDSDSEYYIDRYDFNGTKISTTPIELGEFLKSTDGMDTLKTFFIYNDTLTLITNTDRVKVFKLGNNVYKSFSINPDFNKEFYVYASYVQPIDLGYIYFVNDNNELILLDLNQNKMYTKPISYDDDSFKILNLYFNPIGDVCIEFNNLEASTNNPEYYYNLLSIDEILK